MADRTLIDRYLRARDRAQVNGDLSLARECEFHLRRFGYRPDASPVELERVADRLETHVRPRRGRPPVRRDLPPVPPEAA